MELSVENVTSRRCAKREKSPRSIIHTTKRIIVYAYTPRRLTKYAVSHTPPSVFIARARSARRLFRLHARQTVKHNLYRAVRVRMVIYVHGT